MNPDLMVILILLLLSIGIFLWCVRTSRKAWKEWNAKIELIESHISQYGRVVHLLDIGLKPDEIIKILDKEEKQKDAKR